MKRQQDRETTPKLKRSHQGYVDYDIRDRDLMGSDRDRRDSRGRGPSKYRESIRDHRDSRSDYDSYDREMSKRHSREDKTPVDHYRGGRHDNQPYRTLCCSNLNPRVTDEGISDELYAQFKRFGDFNVRVVHTNDHRIAFVNFRYPEDARDAGHYAINKLVLFDMPVRVETVYNNRPYEGNGQSSNWGSRGATSNSYAPGHSGGGSAQRSGYDGRDRDFQGYREDHGQGRRATNFREGGSGGGGGGSGGKFPHHLNHIEPEDDDKATRTLFVGNLDIETSEEDLRNVFEKFGTVDDIDIKRPSQGNAYAFVKFFNLDMAHRAKVSMSGVYLGKFQCKIGYGKATPSPCLWVGGLGQWLSPEVLEREFDRFGLIHRIEWPHGKSYAYVLYDNIDAATAALKDMRGFPLGGPEHRLRVDFADLNQISGQIPPELFEQMEKAKAAAGLDHNGKDRDQDIGSRSRTSSRNDWAAGDDTRGDYDRTARRDSGMDDRKRYSDGRGGDDERSQRSRGRDFSPAPRDRDSDRGSTRMLSPGHGGKRPRLSPSVDDSMKSPRDISANGARTSGLFDSGNIANVLNVADFAKCLPVVWNGALLLKSSEFMTRLHLISGDVHLVDTLMRDPTSTEMPVLKITQRLRLDQTKIDDVKSRIAAAGPNGHSVLLAQPGSPPEESNSANQTRPLKNLVSYLKQKEAAGIIALPPNPNGRNTKDTGVLHLCPPCAFGNEFLTQRAPKLNLESTKEEYLVVVVVRGSG